MISNPLSGLETTIYTKKLVGYLYWLHYW